MDPSSGAAGLAAERGAPPARGQSAAAEVTALYHQLRFNPVTRKASVRPLSVPVIPHPGALEGLALSPDGTKLAVAYQPDASMLPRTPSIENVYSAW